MLEPVTTAVRPDLIVRPGELHDMELVEAMHRRCSDHSLYRRFHTPLPRVSARMVRQMLVPNKGWSLLGQHQGDVVGFASAAPVSDSVVEVGLLVEDRHQRQSRSVIREGIRHIAGLGHFSGSWPKPVKGVKR